MAPFFTLTELRASPAALQPTSESVRAQRTAILCLPLSLIVLWLGILCAGDGRVDGLGNPIGGDFAMFYVAGQMAARGEWAGLYDEAFQQQRLLELMPGLPPDTYLPYRYPPLVAIFAAPLAYLPYLPAFAVFSCVSLSLWLGAIYQLVRGFMPLLSTTAGTAVIAIGCAPVAVQTFIDGQASLFWFALAAGCWCCVQRERYAVAGCLLALAACKPNVMLLFAVVVCLRHPRVLLGVVPTGIVMFLVTLVLAGNQPLLAYIDLGKQLAWKPWLVETPYWKVQSLLSWTEPMLGGAARRVNMMSGLLLASAVGLWWRRQPRSSAADTGALCAALVINALFNPYTPVYDLTLLCLGMLAGCAQASAQGALSEWLERRDVQATAALVLLGPIVSQGLAKALECPLQLMPLGLLVAAVYWLVRLGPRVATNAVCTSV